MKKRIQKSAEIFSLPSFVPVQKLPQTVRGKTPLLARPVPEKGKTKNANRKFSGGQPSNTRRRLAAFAAGFSFLVTGLTPAKAAPTTMVDLGAAAPYAVLSGASVGNTVSAPGAPHTTVRGDLGIKADVAPTGFPPGVVTGTIRQGSSVDPAHADAVTAYNVIANRTGGVVIAATLVGAVLSPGLYTIAGAASNTGTLTLDAGGDPNAIFVFQVNGALSFAAASHVVLTNGALASRVFWQVNGAGAVGAGGSFAGTLIAKDAVAMGNGTLVNGRAIALNGALTLDNNQFYGVPPVVTIDGGETAFTTDTTPTISGTTDVGAPGQVTVTIAGHTLTATPEGGNWSVTSGILPNGSYAVEASATDGAGNPGSATQQLTVDTEPPVITLDGGASVTTSSSRPIISGTSDVDAGTVIEIKIDSQNLTALVQNDGSWNIRIAGLADGVYQINASVSDPAGNESSATQSITIDTIPPVIRVAVTISGGETVFTTDTTPTISGTTDVEAPGQVTVTIAGQSLTATPDNGNWSVTSGILANGTYAVEASVTDGAGNRGSATQQLTIDTELPVITLDGGPFITTRSSIPTISGTGAAGADTVIEITVDAQILTALVQDDGSWNIRMASLADGIYQITASVIDPAGNRSFAAQSITVDTTPPAIRLSVNPRRVDLSSGQKDSIRRRGPRIKLYLTEPASVRYNITGKRFKAKSFRVLHNEGTSFVRIPKRILRRIGLGKHKIIATATDYVGNGSAHRRTTFRVMP